MNTELTALPTIKDTRGNLSFIESGKHIPFEIQRVFYVYDIPNGVVRGSHAHRKLEQFVVIMSGSFDVVMSDGINEHVVHLKDPGSGLYIPPMTWSRQENFSSGCTYFVLSSEKYDEADYIRNFEEFLHEKQQQ